MPLSSGRSGRRRYPCRSIRMAAEQPIEHLGRNSCRQIRELRPADRSADEQHTEVGTPAGGSGWSATEQHRAEEYPVGRSAGQPSEQGCRDFLSADPKGRAAEPHEEGVSCRAASCRAASRRAAAALPGIRDLSARDIFSSMGPGSGRQPDPKPAWWTKAPGSLCRRRTDPGLSGLPRLSRKRRSSSGRG